MSEQSNQQTALTGISRKCADFCVERGIAFDRRNSRPGTIVLKNLNLDEKRFSKPRTSLCVAQNPKTKQYVAFVDRDLQVLDPDSPAAGFLSGTLQDDWQLVSHPYPFESADEAIISTVNAFMPVPDSPERTKTGVKTLFGKILPEVAVPVDSSRPRPPLVGRSRIVETAGRLLTNQSQQAVVLAGPGGSGLTSCALEVLSQFAGSRQKIVRVDCSLIATDMVFPANTDERTRQLMEDCRENPDALFLFDNLHWLLRGGLLAQLAVATGIERNVRCLATIQSESISLGGLQPSLTRRLHWIELPPLEEDELLEMLLNRSFRLEEERGIRTGPEAIPMVIHLAQTLPGGEPGRLLKLFETAAALTEDGGRLSPDEVAAARNFCSIEEMNPF